MSQALSLTSTLNNMEEVIVILGIIILFALALWRIYIFVRYFWRITKRK